MTDLEKCREEYDPLGISSDTDDDGLTIDEFLAAVKRMKKSKAAGPDGIPAEVWKLSEVARNELYFFLKEV